MVRLQLEPAVCSRLDMAALARRLHSCTSLQHLDLGGAGEGISYHAVIEEDRLARRGFVIAVVWYYTFWKFIYNTRESK